MHKNSHYVQNSVFLSGKHSYPNSLINRKLEVYGISHSLYVKFEINVNSLNLRKLTILFSTVKLRTYIFPSHQ